jgi:hypothetical protein
MATDPMRRSEVLLHRRDDGVLKGNGVVLEPGARVVGVLRRVAARLSSPPA